MKGRVAGMCSAGSTRKVVAICEYESLDWMRATRRVFQPDLPAARNNKDQVRDE